MPGKFELKKSRGGQFMFNLKASNGQVILTSERYKTKASAENGIKSVKSNAKDKMFERLTAKNGQPYFRLKAGNGEVIGRSEMYASTSGRNNGINSVIKNAKGAKLSDLT